MTNLGLRIKTIRKQKGWSQKELAKKSGMSQALISDLESGVKTYLSPKQRNGISKALDITIEELIALEAKIWILFILLHSQP